MKKIVIVVSSFGFGHLTRQIALKNEILKISQEFQIVFVISEVQEKYLSKAVLTHEKVSIERLPITPKLTMKNWHEVEIESTRESYQRFWEWETQIRDDRAWERILFRSSLVISDIESVHHPIAKKMNIPIINISNFTWSDILYNLGFVELSNNYQSWESLSDLDIQLPCETELRSFSNPVELGLLVRPYNPDRVEQIKQLSKGKSRVLLIHSHKDGLNYVKFVEELLRSGYCPIVKVNENFSSEDMIFFEENEVATQDFVAAADIVISKLGYGIVSEVLQSGSFCLFWEREKFSEDNYLGQALLNNNKGKKISHNITSEELIDEIRSIYPNQGLIMQNSSSKIAEYIVDYLDQD